MSAQRRGGIIQVQVQGIVQDAKGEFSYNLGHPKRTSIKGSSGRIQGFTEEAQPAFIEGALTDRGTLDLGALVDAEDVTVTLILAVGKTIVLRDAFYCADGTGKSNEGEVELRFEAPQGEEIPA